jgi:hypothetical protein
VLKIIILILVVVIVAVVVYVWHYIVAFACNATNNFWVLNLVPRFIGSSTWLSYNYSLHKFITHKPETCVLVRYHFLLKLSSYVTFVCISSFLRILSVYASASVFTVFLNCPYLCLHLLKTVFRQPSREHLLEPFSFLYSDTPAASVFVAGETLLLRLSFPW